MHGRVRDGHVQIGSPPPEQRFHVFLSHNGRDKPVVERIATFLKQAGMEPWLDIWNLVPGEPFRPELERGLLESATCAVCIGPAGLSDWVDEEVSVALNRAVKQRDFRVFLVLLPGLPEPFDPSGLPAFLSTRTWVDLRRGVKRERDIQPLIGAVFGTPPNVASHTVPLAGTCPYRGLQAFDESHAEFYFGRDADVQRLLEQLKTTRFLAVLGPSGAGKSSLVRAGVIPTLRAGLIPESQEWTIRVFKPGSRPLTELAVQLAQLDPAHSPLTALDELARDRRALDLLGASNLDEASRRAGLVWVVDQFEEVFTLCQDDCERSSFIDNLMHAATTTGGRTRVILTMRADFYARLAAWPELAAQAAAHQYLVSPLGPEGLREVIEEPARLVGLEFEQGLVETILQEVQEQPGALPLLEHALLELWERRRGQMLTLEAYRESGGVQGAIAQRAETLFGNLEPEQQRIVRGVLLRLTQPGEGVEDTRRRAKMDELVQRGVTAAEIEASLAPLINARLLTAGLDEVSGERELDVAHEALIRAWPRLRAWIDEDRAGLRIHRRLTEAALDWEANEREDGLLYRGARLTTALEWRTTHESELNDLELNFLNASVALRDREQRQRQRRIRLTIGGLSLALLLISLTAVIAVVQRDSARAAADRQATAEAQALLERDTAQLARDEAFAREITANARAIAAGDPELALLLLIETMQIQPLPETVQVLQGMLVARPLDSFEAAMESTWIGEMDLSPTGSTLASLDANGGLHIWSVGDFAHQRKLAEGQDFPALSADGARIASVGDIDTSGSVDGPARLHVWDVASGEEILNLIPHDQLDCSSFSVQFDFSLDGTLLVSTCTYGQTVRVWDVESGEQIAEFDPQGSSEFSWSLSPDSTTIATSDESGIALWDARTGLMIASLPGSSFAMMTTFSEDGSHIIAEFLDNSIAIYNTASHLLVNRIFASPSSAESLLPSPDMRLIARETYGNLDLRDDPALEIWEVESGAPVATIAGHSAEILDIEFSHDARWILTTSDDSTVRLWDARTGLEVVRFLRSSANAAFTPDGDGIITGEYWLDYYSLDALDATNDELLQMARGSVTRELTAAEREQYLHE